MTHAGTPEFQVTFDAADPHRLSGFWAEALGYEREDHTQVVRGLLASGRLPEQAVIETETGVGFRDLAACSDPGGRRARLLFQRVPEEKTAKNRVHLDVHIGDAERVEAEADRLVALGASRAWVSDDRGVHCVTLRDPEGNEFCVT